MKFTGKTGGAALP